MISSRIVGSKDISTQVISGLINFPLLFGFEGKKRKKNKITFKSFIAENTSHTC